MQPIHVYHSEVYCARCLLPSVISVDQLAPWSLLMFPYFFNNILLGQIVWVLVYLLGTFVAVSFVDWRVIHCWRFHIYTTILNQITWEKRMSVSVITGGIYRGYLCWLIRYSLLPFPYFYNIFSNQIVWAKCMSVSVIVGDIRRN